MARNIRYPKYRIREYPDRIKEDYTFEDKWPYVLYRKLPLIPVYYPLDSYPTLEKAIHLKQMWMKHDEKKKQKHWISDEEQFAEIL
jgi:hypothetical protein